MQHVADSRWLMLAVLFLARVALGYQFQSVASTAPLLVEQLGIGYAQVGTLIGMYMLPGVVIALPGGLLGHRFGDKAICTAGLTLMILGGWLLGYADDYGISITGRPGRTCSISAVIALSIHSAPPSSGWARAVS